MTFRNLSAGRSIWLALVFMCALGGTTFLASRSALAFDELGHVSQESPGGGSGYEVTHPGDDDQPTIKKRRLREISSIDVPQEDTATMPHSSLRAAGPERANPVPAGVWLRVAFDLWLGMLR